MIVIASNTPIGAYTYPSLADSPNVPSNLQTLATQLDLTTLPRFTTLSAANTAIPSPTQGQHIVITGTVNHILFWNGTAWQAPSEQLIQAITVSGSPVNILYSSIPTYFRHLVIRYSLASSLSPARQDLGIQFNGISTASYGYGGFVGDGAHASSATVEKVGADNAARVGTMMGVTYDNTNASNASRTAYGEILIPNYGSTNLVHQFVGTTVTLNDGGSGAGIARVCARQGYGTNGTLGAITSLTLITMGGSGSFVNNGLVQLYGRP